MWAGRDTGEFLAFGAGLDLDQARLLVDKVSPRLLVIRMGDEVGIDMTPAASPVYYVLDTAELLASLEINSDWSTIGDAVRDRFTPAIVLETDDGWLTEPADLDKRDELDAVVVDDDGVISRVVRGLQPLQDAALPEREAPTRFWRHLHQVWNRAVLGPTGATAAHDPDAGGIGGNAELAADGGGPESVAAGDVPGKDDGGVPEDLGPMALEVRFPDAVKLGDTVPVLVLLEPGPGGPGSAPLSVKADEVLEIMVSPTSGFTLVDKAAKPMRVVRDGQTLPVKFDLRADVAGKGVVKVFAFREGTCVASLSVSAQIAVTAVTESGVSPATLPVPAVVRAVADLDLMVLKESYRGGIALRYRLANASSSVTADFGPHPLDSDPSAYVHAKFSEIQELSREPGGWSNARRTRLARIGSDLYESLVPPDLQDVLWNSDRVRSLLVQTEEPWIPWELCRMTVRRPNGSTEARGYLCELYDMSRWLPGVPPKTDLHASRVAVIAPRDSGLPSATNEVEMLAGLSASGPSVERLKATYESVIAALESHRFDLIHFVGHGRNAAPDDTSRSEFLLAGQWRLTPSDITGETRNLGLATPVVFMNVCEVAQASMGLHGIGGWAAAMTKAGAGAFIGTHWDVRDDLAGDFAAAFYRELATPGVTVAAATRTARRALSKRPDGGATWLAYSLHASPGAACRFGAPAA